MFCGAGGGGRKETIEGGGEEREGVESKPFIFVP